MDVAKLFTNGRSQAVRLPREYRFPDDEVLVSRIDDMVILLPRRKYAGRKGWELLARSIPRFTEDFMAERAQERAPERRRRL